MIRSYLNILKNRKKTALVILFVLLIGLVLFLKRHNSEIDYIQNSRPLGGDFKVDTHRGIFDTVEHRGEVIFLFFGFSRCPSICPLTISNLDRFLNNLSNQKELKASVVFVSVDSERDSLELFQKKYSNLNLNFYAAVPSKDELSVMLKKYGAMYSSQGERDNAYIEHSDDIYLLNEKGQWFDTLKYDSSVMQIQAAASKSKTKPSYVELLMNQVNYKLIGKNDDCDLSLSDCVVDLGNKERIALKLNPKPIVSSKNLKAELELNSNRFEKVKIEVRGVERDMGFIESDFSKNIFGGYSAEFYLPFCELKKMNWKANLLLTGKNKEYYAVSFKFKTDN